MKSPVRLRQSESWNFHRSRALSPANKNPPENPASPLDAAWRKRIPGTERSQKDLWLRPRSETREQFELSASGAASAWPGSWSNPECRGDFVPDKEWMNLPAKPSTALRRAAQCIAFIKVDRSALPSQRTKSWFGCSGEISAKQPRSAADHHRSLDLAQRWKVPDACTSQFVYIGKEHFPHFYRAMMAIRTAMLMVHLYGPDANSARFDR